MSRAALGRRFTQVVGEPPMTFLTKLAPHPRRRPVLRAGKHHRLCRPSGRICQPLRPQRRLQTGPRHQPKGTSPRSDRVTRCLSRHDSPTEALQSVFDAAPSTQKAIGLLPDATSSLLPWQWRLHAPINPSSRWSSTTFRPRRRARDHRQGRPLPDRTSIQEITTASDTHRLCSIVVPVPRRAVESEPSDRGPC